MVKLIFTQGISGSGKSTWAKKQTDAVVIERDEIREILYPGYWKSAPDSKKEKHVNNHRNLLIKQALKNHNCLIFSDTNLNKNYIEETKSFVDSNATIDESDIVTFYDSLDLEKCLDRNKKRERIVPEDVLCSQFKRFQAIHNLDAYSFNSSNKPIIWISDLHGRWGKFKEIRKKYSPDDYTIISCGDLNDIRSPGNDLSSWCCLNSFYIAHLLGKDQHLLHSNHQYNLIRIARGRRDITSYGMLETLSELKDLELLNFSFLSDDKLNKNSITISKQLQKVINFLDTRPIVIRIKHNNEYWLTAHGFVSRSQGNKFNPFPKKPQQYIYGPNRERTEWWLDREKDSSVQFKTLVGHNHTDFRGSKTWVLDPKNEDIIAVVLFENGKDPVVELF